MQVSCSNGMIRISTEPKQTRRERENVLTIKSMLCSIRQEQSDGLGADPHQLRCVHRTPMNRLCHGRDVIGSGRSKTN
jgi:hypothetical protein